MKKSLVVILILLCSLQVISAQIGLGFKAGLTLGKLDGPSEMVDSELLEEYTSSTGFQIGVVFNFEVTDLFGFRSELLYSQKSSKYKYDGLGYFFLIPTEELVARGNKLIELDINNTYLDIPIMSYYRFGKLEVNGGINVGLLLGSKASGIRQFNGFTEGSGAEVKRFEQLLNYNYLGDKPQEFNELEGVIRVDQNGTEVLIPRVPLAYFDYPPLQNQFTQSSLYKRFEMALVGGLQFYPNKGLSLGVRYHHGLSDVTNGEVDISQAEIDDGDELIFRPDDKDKNRVFQFSLMFLF